MGEAVKTFFSSLFSVALIKHTDPKQLEGKGFISVYTSRQQSITEGSQTGTRSRDCGGRLPISYS